MITQTLKTLSGNVKIKIPTDLSEITLGQMIEMQSVVEGDNSIPLIPGLTAEVCDNIIDLEQLIDIRDRVLSIAHQIHYCYNETKLPEYITFGTKKVKRFGVYFERDNKVNVIKNLCVEPAGALFASRDIIAEERMRHIKEYGDNWEENFVPSLDACAGILAHYFYCNATGLLYSTNKAEAFKSEVLKLSIQDTLPIVRFFFLKYPNLSRQKITLYHLFRLNLKKRLESKSLNNLAT